MVKWFWVNGTITDLWLCGFGCVELSLICGNMVMCECETITDLWLSGSRCMELSLICGYVVLGVWNYHCSVVMWFWVCGTVTNLWKYGYV